MPRKSSKTAKPSLLFAEKPVCSTSLSSFPEVRAALHPKEFFAETPTRSHLSSWVNPQFETSLESTAPTKRRGRRRKCILGKNLQDTCSPSSKKSQSNFPLLSFQSNGHLPRPHRAKRSHVSHADSGGEASKNGACQRNAPTRQIFKKRDIASCSSSSSPPVVNEGTSICAPPNVDTPKVMLHAGHDSSISPSSSSSSSSSQWLLTQPCTPPRSQPPETLVPDTPERHYNLKVTWRRRLWLMAMLEERGQLTPWNKLITS
ncbi:RAD9, HUS1, RAD1-interacting nuclear orphan protein 1 [Syngnathus typhle]|uniref:RAD9, HUS1, RAD1-interacting nuclear orphan protein 1 n=1 Tax=Syngnathus typhle TaxID=161592 RepID=UPI002A69982B|nr:RAD9, HUS1, RAD1-interacting nuclear orphan protein 1 [Syngnathus typhle]